MRIDGTSRTQAAGYAALGRRAEATGGFAPEADIAAARAGGSGPAAATADINALLALQSAEDAVAGRKKAIRRGRQMLDVLDEMKADLLAGRVGEGHLNQLVALVGQARSRTAPGLDSALDDVELRARVELAKAGRFFPA